MAFGGRPRSAFVKEHLFLGETIPFSLTADSARRYLYHIKIGKITSLSDAFKLCSVGETAAGDPQREAFDILVFTTVP